jgi:hypothetical protein
MNLFKRTILPVIVALVAAACISGLWYSPMLFGRQWVALRSQALNVAADSYIAPWKSLVEIIREIVVAYVLTRLVSRLKITRLTSALNLGFWIWMGFPVTMLVGASLWDNKPWALSLIHGGDWLTKMIVMSVLITLTRRLTLGQQEYQPVAVGLDATSMGDRRFTAR